MEREKKKKREKENGKAEAELGRGGRRGGEAEEPSSDYQDPMR